MAYRVVVEARLEHRSQKDIAELLCKSQGSISSWMSAGEAYLAAVLQGAEIVR